MFVWHENMSIRPLSSRIGKWKKNDKEGQNWREKKQRVEAEVDWHVERCNEKNWIYYMYTVEKINYDDFIRVFSHFFLSVRFWSF